MNEDAEIVQEFLVESHENLDQLDRDLVELEKQPGSRELLSSIFRTIHTIKGTSGFLAFHQLENLTHAGENLLSRLRDGEITLHAELTTVLLEMVDAVRRLLGEIEQSGTEGDSDCAPLAARLNAMLEVNDSMTVPDEPVSVPVAAGQVIAVKAHNGATHNVDDLTIALAEHEFDETHLDEVHLDEVNLGEAQNDDLHLDDVHLDETPSSAGKRSVADSSIRVDVDLLDSLMNLVGELVLTRNQMLQCAASREDVELQRTTHRLNLIAGELQEGVMKTRMQSIDNVWSKLPRVVRDLSLSLGKNVQLTMEGRDTELDKTILEAVRDPLTHLVRNSVDHGIETPEQRRAAGKPEQGSLLLRAFHEGGQVNIEISDDGAGIDPAKLREKAISRGMLTREAAAEMTDREAIFLIFSAGFSTAAKVTNVSGRGVGMDVVKTNIEKIGGNIDLASVSGEGTTVRIRIPLTLAIIPALVVSAGANRYAIPQVNLLELVRLESDQRDSAIETVQGTPVHRLRGRLLPLVDLREQLGLPGAAQDTTYIAVLQADDRQFGLVVDHIRDTEEIVVKPLGVQLRGLTLYAGATIMGDGQIALILDATALARRAGMALDGTTAANKSMAAATVTSRTSLLVVGLSDGRRVAIPLGAIDRLENLARERIEHASGREVVQYRDAILPLLQLDHALNSYGEPSSAGGPLQVVVCRNGDRLIGVVVTSILDIVEQELPAPGNGDTAADRASAIIGGHVTELVDIDQAIAAIDPSLLAPVGAR